MIMNKTKNCELSTKGNEIRIQKIGNMSTTEINEINMKHNQNSEIITNNRINCELSTKGDEIGIKKRREKQQKPRKEKQKQGKN
jgi:hypothetical protein